MPKLRTPLLLAALIFTCLALTGRVRADDDFGGGEGGARATHESRHRDYESSSAADEAAWLTLLPGGQKRWVCSVVGPYREGATHAQIPGGNTLEAQAMYTFERVPGGGISAHIRDLSIVPALDSIFRRRLPVFGARAVSCEFKLGTLNCPGADVLEQYVRHFDAGLGIVYLLIENTYPTPVIGGHTLPRSKSDGERYLGSFYHCIPSPL